MQPDICYPPKIRQRRINTSVVSGQSRCHESYARTLLPATVYLWREKLFNNGHWMQAVVPPVPQVVGADGLLPEPLRSINIFLFKHSFLRWGIYAYSPDKCIFNKHCSPRLWLADPVPQPKSEHLGPSQHFTVSSQPSAIMYTQSAETEQSM